MEQGIDNVVPASPSVLSPSRQNPSKIKSRSLRNTIPHSLQVSSHAAQARSLSGQAHSPEFTTSTTSTSSRSQKEPYKSKVELRQRKRSIRSQKQTVEFSSDPRAAPPPRTPARKMEEPHPKTRPSWLVLALASGAFAAFNGAFAKLYVDPIARFRL